MVFIWLVDWLVFWHVHAGHAYAYGKQDKRATSLSSLLGVFGSLKENLVALFLVGSPSCLTLPGKKSTTLLNSGGSLSLKLCMLPSTV